MNATQTAEAKLAAKIAAQSTPMILASLAADVIESPKVQEHYIVRAMLCEELDRRMTEAQHETMLSFMDDDNFETFMHYPVATLYTLALAS